MSHQALTDSALPGRCRRQCLGEVLGRPLLDGRVYEVDVKQFGRLKHTQSGSIPQKRWLSGALGAVPALASGIYNQMRLHPTEMLAFWVLCSACSAVTVSGKRQCGENGALSCRDTGFSGLR